MVSDLALAVVSVRMREGAVLVIMGLDTNVQIPVSPHVGVLDV